MAAYLIPVDQLVQAVKTCRKYPHGCYLYQEAKTVITNIYRNATGDMNPSLDTLWGWVNERLEEIDGINS